jgi:tetratricopeptide (TPR) repeat protein
MINYRVSLSGRMVKAIASTVAIAACLVGSPAYAADPFRTTNPHEIGDTTETAFRTLFEQGNYQQADRYLDEAENQEPNEPLVYAMQAAFAYLDEDWDALGDYATQTRETAESLMNSDSLRGHLYSGVGHFLEGAYILSTEGTIPGTPKALKKLRLVLQHMDAAEKVNATDPELNLIKGFMDLMLAVNLPFAEIDDAITRLEDYAGPNYLAYRGIAVGYRDTDQHANALAAVNQALEITPNNPELFYLKAQILVEQGLAQESLAIIQQAQENFAQALAQAPEKFPKGLKKQLQRESDRNARRIQEMVANSEPS